MRPWQPLLLIASLLVAASLAAGGWALGRWRSHVIPTGAGSSTAQKPSLPSSIAPVGKPSAEKPIAAPDARGWVQLDLTSATLIKNVKRTDGGSGKALVGWSSRQDKAVWQFRAHRPGFFNAELTYATGDTAAEAELELHVGDRKRLCSLRSSGGLDQFITDEYPMAVPTSGVHQLTIQPHSDLPGEWFVLRSVRLIPTKTDKAVSVP
jgi:hypothetical protein